MSRNVVAVVVAAVTVVVGPFLPLLVAYLLLCSVRLYLGLPPATPAMLRCCGFLGIVVAWLLLLLLLCSALAAPTTPSAAAANLSEASN